MPRKTVRRAKKSSISPKHIKLGLVVLGLILLLVALPLGVVLLGGLGIYHFGSKK